MELGRIILLLEGEAHSIVRRTLLTKLFVLGDVLSFLVQSTGEQTLGFLLIANTINDRCFRRLPVDQEEARRCQSRLVDYCWRSRPTNSLLLPVRTRLYHLSPAYSSKAHHPVAEP